MADRPILFSAPMVRALLAGTKTQTRRILKPQPNGDVIHYGWQVEGGAFWTDQHFESHRLHIWAGDRLWVREAWRLPNSFDEDSPVRAATRVHPSFKPNVFFEADGAVRSAGAATGKPGRLRASMHMPRWASRLTLTVSDVRVQRLQEISRDDAVSEGLIKLPATGRWVIERGDQYLGAASFDPRSTYAQLWDEINGAGAWAANPRVAAYTFTVERRNIDMEAPHV